tara:strand:+ start:26374 stop:26655 length:282 start_codon:yes stop_codon:yes gene_type:complete
MTNVIEDHTAADKVKEARAALRGMNKHIGTIVLHNDEMAKLMEDAAQLLRDISDQMGGIVVNIPPSPYAKKEPASLKRALQDIATKIHNGAAR